MKTSELQSILSVTEEEMEELTEGEAEELNYQQSEAQRLMEDFD